MAIQKSKYDGSEEKFNEWVVRSNLGNTPTEESQNEANHEQGI